MYVCMPSTLEKINRSKQILYLSGQDLQIIVVYFKTTIQLKNVLQYLEWNKLNKW